MGRFIIVSGPSCVGKGPLFAALRKFHRPLFERMRSVVLYNDRAPRPMEVDGEDYHFRSREEIEALRDREGYSVFEARGDLQAVDHGALRAALEAGDLFYEGNPMVGTSLLDSPLPEGVERLSVFLSPLSREEIETLRDGYDAEATVAEIMRRKLLRRTRRQRGLLAQTDLEEIERRCRSAWSEVGMAHRFQWVIPNHDGEDSENWDAFAHPVGDAFRVLKAFAALLEGRTPDGVERWDASVTGEEQ